MSNIEKALKKQNEDLEKETGHITFKKQKQKNINSIPAKNKDQITLSQNNVSINTVSSNNDAKLNKLEESIISASQNKDKKRQKDTNITDIENLQKKKRDETIKLAVKKNKENKFDNEKEIPDVPEPKEKNIIQQLDKINSGELIYDTENVEGKEMESNGKITSTKLNSYQVNEQVVSYYEYIGKHIWEGPVMVHFRRLKLMLNNVQKNDKCKVIVFASAEQDEGKSLIALNTAITLCKDKNVSVTIVDCDFRKSSVNKLLGFKPEKGLADYLNDNNLDLKDVSFSGLVPRLTTIPVGNKPSHICELLASDRMEKLLSYLKGACDYVIIDTPPISAFPDAQVVSALADGVVLVIDSSKTKKRKAKRAIETLHNCKLLGCVMNKSEISSSEYYRYSYT